MPPTADRDKLKDQDLLRLLRWRKRYVQPTECSYTSTGRNCAEIVYSRCQHIICFLKNAEDEDSKQRLSLVAELSIVSRQPDFKSWWRVCLRSAKGLEDDERCDCYVAPRSAKEGAQITRSTRGAGPSLSKKCRDTLAQRTSAGTSDTKTDHAADADLIDLTLSPDRPYSQTTTAKALSCDTTPRLDRAARSSEQGKKRKLSNLTDPEDPVLKSLYQSRVSTISTNSGCTGIETYPEAAFPCQSSQPEDTPHRIDDFIGNDLQYATYLVNRVGAPAIPLLEKLVTYQRMADGITSTGAILRFQDLITESREFALLRERLPDDDKTCLTTLCALYSSQMSGQGALSLFYRTVTGIQLVQQVDKMTGKMARTRADSEKLSQTCGHIGLTPKGFQSRYRHLSKLSKALTSYDGLQCFLPFEEGALTKYFDICPETIGPFRDALKKCSRVKRLCEVGRSFLDSLWTGRCFPEQLWESWTAEERCRLDADRLVELLAPFEPPGWPKPTGWPWAWPARPDGVVDGQHCELCSKDSCDCITTRFRWDFTVAPCGEKGQGLLAGVPGRDTLAFTKGDLLGRLVGEFVAPDKFADGWGFELKRTDLNNRPVVAQIYTRTRGNDFRLVNHACGDFASARVDCLRVSGLFTPVFSARRDLMDGHEITVDWGLGSLNGRDCLCDGCKK